MRDKKEFYAILKAIDGQVPAEYAKLVGDFDFSRFVLHSLRIDAATGRSTDTAFVLHVPQMIAGFPAGLFNTPIRRTALEDFIARMISNAIETNGAGDMLFFARPGSQILPRSSVVVAADYLEARISIRLPLRDGLIHSDEAIAIFFESLPAIVNQAMIYCNLDEDDLTKFVHSMEDADQIRQGLLKNGLVSFVANGTRLGSVATALQIPEGPAASLPTANSGTLRGLGIPVGITVIVGDPYSGRSDLLNLIGAGIYNHVPGDNGERAITVPDAVQILADRDRPAQCVNITPFVTALPDKKPAAFTTAAATPAESQMAGTMEAIQSGATVLIYDEATSDPTFLSADSRLSALSPSSAARVSPLSARIRQMADELRLSFVIGVWAGAAEFLSVADTVLVLEEGQIHDVTKKAREQAAGVPRTAAGRATLPPSHDKSRWIIPSSIDPSKGREDAVIEAQGTHRLRFGRHLIRLESVPQLADPAQTTAIGLILNYIKSHFLDESRTVAEVLDLIDHDLSQEGLDVLARELRPDLARPRRFEIAAALNRLDSLRIVSHRPTPGDR